MNRTASGTWGLALVLLIHVGCARHHQVTIPAPVPEPPPPLGSLVEPSFALQELHGEASDFVIYEHEFAGHTPRLTPAGEAHLRQIAVRAPQVPFPIVVESALPDISPLDPAYVTCSDLDAQRRTAIATALTMMGVPGASQRVVVGTPLAAGLTAGEADRSYQQAISGGSNGGGRMGGGSGAGGGFGGGLGGGF